MVQTPTQRRANEKYAKHEISKRGKPESAAKQRTKQKPSISTTWIVLLVFAICCGGIIEILRLFF